MASYAAGRYQDATALLPRHLRHAALSISLREQKEAEEIRLRAGQRLCLTMGEGSLPLSGPEVTQEDLEQVVDLVTGYSRYAAAETIRQGYLIAPGGFRLGICGSAVMQDGAIAAIRDISSAAIRIPREQPGIAVPVLDKLWTDREKPPASTLILSAPGGGKTTFLRDLVRQLSDPCGLRVAIADERGELAAVCRGRAQLQVGRHTDVMDACPKALAIPALLRSMNPQVIAVDEVTLQEDVIAMERAINAGTVLLASVHGGSVEELRRKPLMASLLATKAFTKAVCIRKEGTRRCYDVEDLI